MEKYCKPYLSLEEQIQTLKDRGMSVVDDKSAASYLEQIGYYRLSGFWYPFRKSSFELGKNGRPINVILDDFRPNTSFQGAIELYVFDKKLRLLFLDALERIEVALRTCIALQMGEYNPWSYRDKSFLDGHFGDKVPRGKKQSKFDYFISKYDRSFENSKEDFVVHFKKTYTNPLPVWAAVELWDFGSLSVFLEGMKYKDKRKISEKFNIARPELLPTWVRTLSFVRNICAHHSRLWNKPLIAQPKPPKMGEIPLLEHLIGDEFALQRPYAAAAITIYLLKQINPTSRWSNRCKEVVQGFPEGPGISVGQIGFPVGWETLELWN